MRVRILLFLFLLLVGCRGGSYEIPAGIISQDTMVNIMADIHVAESRVVKNGNNARKSEIKSAYLQQVLKTKSIDTARFFKSFDFYSEHPELFAVMYDSVVVELSKRQAEARKEIELKD